jgi:hypothetical protein
MSRFDDYEEALNDELGAEVFDPSSDLSIRTIDYDPSGNPNSQRAIDLALTEGLIVKFPAANELFIDIDNEHSLQMFHRQMDIVYRYVDLGAPTKITPSRNGLPGRHIVVTLAQDITETERLLLQACMGSDRVRELLGYIQLKSGDPHPNLFLEKTEEPQKLLTEGQ